MVPQSQTPPLSITALNNFSAAEAADLLLKCNGSKAWVEEMMRARPFEDPDALFAAAEKVWHQLPHADVLEGFNRHPRC